MALIFNFDFGATKAALLYFASKKLSNFDKYRASKLLFLADHAHLLRFGRPITGDAYSALPFGPTPEKTLSLLNGLVRVALEGDDPISDEIADLARSFAVTDLEHPTYHPKCQPDLDALSKSDLQILDQVITDHGHKSFDELKTLTHGMKAYTNVWRDNDIRKKFPMTFEDFFAEDPDKADFLREIAEEQHLTKLWPMDLDRPKAMIA